MSAARNWANTLAHTSRHCAPKPCGTSPSLVTGIWPLTNRMRWASDTSSACEYQPTGGGASSELINRFFIELPLWFAAARKKGGPKAALSQNPVSETDQFAALDAGLSDVAGPLLLAVALMPCSRSAAVLSAVSSLASGGT